MIFIIAILKEVLNYVIFFVEAFINFAIVSLKANVTKEANLDVLKDIGEEAKGAVFSEKKI